MQIYIFIGSIIIGLAALVWWGITSRKSYKTTMVSGTPLKKFIFMLGAGVLSVITAIVSFFVLAFVALLIICHDGCGSTYGTPLYRPKSA